MRLGQPSIRSMVLVAWQGAALLGVLWPLPTHGSKGWLVLAVAGVVIALAALAVHHRELSPFPEPTASALITQGPYRWVRHPMYLSLALIALGVVLWRLQWLTSAAALLLMIGLVIKIRFEERMLCQAFADYAAYQQRTAAMFPGVW